MQNHQTNITDIKENAVSAVLDNFWQTGEVFGVSPNLRIGKSLLNLSEVINFRW